jgi:TRAP-type transport system small permease protein
VVQKIIDKYCQVLSYLIAAALALMVVLVFGNVVMRYAFNSGFSVSEELSRWLFVWLTFLGAVVALKDNGHLGTDMLVGRLGPAGKKVCMGVSLLLMLFCLWLLFKGSYDQTLINWGTTSAVMEVSVAWFYASGMAFAALGSVIVLNDFWRLLTGQIADADLVLMSESEEAPHGTSHDTKN